MPQDKPGPFGDSVRASTWSHSTVLTKELAYEPVLDEIRETVIYESLDRQVADQLFDKFADGRLYLVQVLPQVFKDRPDGKVDVIRLSFAILARWEDALVGEIVTAGRAFPPEFFDAALSPEGWAHPVLAVLESSDGEERVFQQVIIKVEAPTAMTIFSGVRVK